MKSLLRYSLLIGKLLTLSVFSMAQLAVDITIDKHVSCPNGDDGQFTVNLTGMVGGNYYIQWENLDNAVTDFRVISLPKTSAIFPTEGDGKVSILAGDYAVTVIKLSSPVEVINRSIKIKEPDVLTFLVTQPTCAVTTGSIQIDSPVDSKGGVYTFRYSIDGGTTYQASPLFEGLSAGSNNISVEISSHTLCFLTDAVTINTAPIPPVTPEATVTQPTCAVATGTIEVTLPLGANYQYSNDFEATWQDGTTFSNLVPDTYLVTARSKIDNTCKSNKIFTINPQPTLPAAPTVNITQPSCGGPAKGLIDVISPLGAEYEYSIDGAIYQSSTNFSDINPGTYSVTVRLVASPSCVSSPTPAIINAPSGAPELVTPSIITHPTTPSSSDGEIAVTLVPATGASPFTYFLTDNLGTPVANSGSISANSHTFLGLGEGNYTVYVTDNASCTSASETGIILMAPVSCTDAVISLTSGNDNQTVCQGESITAIVYTIAGDFSSASVSGLPTGVTGFLIGTTYTISGTPTAAGTFNYTVTVVGSGTCSGDVANGTIVVNAPTIPLFGQLGPYCLGDVAGTLPTTSTNGITGSWSPATVSTAIAGTTTYNFTPTTGQCATTASMNITVNSAPANVDAGPDVTICLGESTQLTGSADLPSNNNVLFSEDFSGVSSGSLPAGWTRNSSYWGSMNSNYSGGSAPEMALLTDGSTDVQTYRVITPLVDASSDQFLDLSFTHALDHYNGRYTIAVETSPDGVSWTNRWLFEWPGSLGGDIAPEAINLDLSTLDGQSFYIAFTYSGKMFNINSWSFDDVMLTGLQSDPVNVLWTPSTGLSDPSILSPIATPSSTTTYTLTVGIGGCENSDQVTVTVKDNITPVFSLDPTYAYCIDDSPVVLPLVSDNGINGTWDPNFISTDVPGLTTYTFTPNLGECAISTSIDVQVFDLPSATMSGGGEYCEGANPTGVNVQIDFTGQAPWTYSFSVDGDVRTFTSNVNPRIFEDVGEGHFSLLSVQDANCTGTVSGEAFVIETPAPTATISGGGDYCAGTSPTGVDVTIEFTGSSPWRFVYAIDGVNQPMVTNVNTSPYTISNANIGTYTLITTSDASCNGTVSGTATVTELVTPTATISGGGDYCAGTTPTGVDVSIALTGNGPWDIVYAIDGTNQAAITGILTSPYVISNVPAGEYTLTSVDDSNGCNGTVSGTVTVNELVAPTATISGGGNYCAGTTPTGVDVSIALTGNGPWDIVYAIDGTNQAAITGVLTSPYVISNAIEGEYTLSSVYDSNSCDGLVIGTVTVTELVIPTAIISGGGDYCAGIAPTGVDVSIALTGNGPWDIVYAIDGTNQAAIIGILTSPHVLSNVTAGEYTLTSVDDSNGCVGTVSGAATVIELVAPTATLSGGGSYCAGTTPTGVDVSIALTGNGPWDVVYAIDGTNQAAIIGILTSPHVLSNVTAGEYTLTSVDDSNSCSGMISGTATVTELVAPTATLSGGGSYCAGTTPTGVDVSIALTGNGPWDIVYAIDGINQAAVIGIPTSPYVLSNVIAGEYTLTSVDDSNGCSGMVSGTATVTELVAPTAILSGGGSYCAGTTPTGVDISIALTGNGPWDIVYAIDGTNQAAITGILTSPYVLSNVTAGEYILTSVDDSNGCVGTVSGTATVIEHELPTATMSGGGAYCTGANPTGIDVQIDFTGQAPWTYSFAVDGDVRTFISIVNQRIFEDVGEGHFTLLSVQDANCTGTVSGEAFVVEIPIPTATVGGGGDYCAGILLTGIDVTFEFTGSSPWSIVYAIDGVNQPAVTNITTSPYILSNAAIGTYTLVSFADASCNGTVSGTATVTELIAPTATINGGGDYCAGTTPTGVDVSIALTGNGPWDIVYAINGTNQAAITSILTSPYVISNVTAGEYTLTSVDDSNGCFGVVSGTVTVTELEVPTAIISGGGDYCAGTAPTGINVSIVLTGNGPWDIVYAIDGINQAAITSTLTSPYVISNAIEGVYTLTSVDDTNGCVGVVSGIATVTELEVPTAIISGGGFYCAGTEPTGVDVSIALTGNGPWDIVYAIDGINQAAITGILTSPYVISNAIEGEYTLISVDDSNGCIGVVSGTVTVTEHELPTATMSGGGAYCIGANPTGIDVQIDFTGEAPWTYSFAVDGDVRTFNTSVSPRLFEDAGEGVFTIISVSDANCTGTVFGGAVVDEIETAAPTGPITQEFCAGATIADINVTGEGITWYDAPNGNVLVITNALVNGVTYYATQTAEGCESLSHLAVTVTVWDALTISVINVENGRCDIPNAGSIDVQGGGGAFPYTYTLFDDLDSQVGAPIVSINSDPVSFTGLTPGKYYVVFDDVSSCDAKTTAIIDILEAIPVTIDDVLISNSKCFGDDNATIEVTASGGGTNLYFSLLDNSNIVIVGPQIDDGVLLGVPDGEYTILVMGENGCEARLAIEVNGPDEFSVQTDIINIPCSYSGDVGIVRALALGGTAPYTISLYLNGILTEQVTGVGYNSWVEFDQLPVGSNYEVVVDDRWGCGPVSSGALEITLPSALVVGAPIVQDVLCNGDATGQVTITASGGTAPYTFTLLDNSNNAIATSTNGVFENVAFGNNYSISVVDDNACNQVFSSLFDINEPDPIVIDINSILVNSISCYGAANGEVSISASGGTGDLYYTLTNAGLTIGGPQLGNGAFTGLSSGGYIIEVTDDRNCGPVLSDVIDIDEPEQLIVQVIVNNPLCNDNIGSINVLASKGTSPYTYELYTGVTLTETLTGVTDEEVVFNNLASATYFVKITDANGCTLFTDNEAIEVAPEKLLLTLNSTDPILNNDGTTVNGTIEATASGGTVPYHYFLFKLGETVSLDDNVSGIFSIIEGGAYQVKVIDANGCEVIGDIALSQYTFTLSGTDVLCFGSCDGTITVNQVYGSSTLDQRKWLNSNEEDISAEMNGKYDVAEGLYKGICAGIYTLIAEGAASIETITVGQPDILDVQTSITPIICYTDENVGEVNFTISGGTPFGDGLYDISWADGMTPVRTNVVSNLAPSIYTFVISDANGCEQTEEVEISYPAPMTITSPNIYPLNCFGINKGEISIWAEGNTPTLEYRIEGPLDSEYEHTNNSGIFTNLAAGSYKVFITDGNGCTQAFPEGEDVYEVTQPSEIVISTLTDITQRLCHNDTIGVGDDGIIMMNVEGGTGDYTYGWDNGQQTLNLEYPIPGLYVLTVTDENQCVALKNVEIPGPEPIIITFEYDTADCRVVDIGIGNVNGGINISAITGGNAESGSDYSLKWYRGTNDEHLTDFDNNLHLKGRQANEFYAVVTDLEGCIDTTDFAIPVDENNLFDVLITKDNNYCYRDQAYLTALVETPNLISVDSYRWVNVTDNPDIENKRVSNVYTTGELLHSTLFRVDAVSKKGCIESAEATLSVYPRIGPFIDRDTHPFFVASDLDAFKVETEDGESYSDSTIISLLADTQYPIEIFTENADYTLSYSWTPVTCFEPNNEKQTVMIFRTGEYQSLLTGAITNQTTHKVEQYIPIVAMVKSEYECIEEVNLKARILDKIKNSNVFSPNGDGINDLWKIPYSDVIPNLEIKIFNRWGANVWSAKGSEAIKGWDGKNSRGKDLSIGTYYYVISFNVVGTNKWKPISGSVTIIR